jgi:sulfide dehydrogenase cytochrome subunit
MEEYMRKTLLYCCLFSLAQGAVASGQDVDKTTRFMAANCAYCHGPDGKSTSAIPGLAGMHKARFVGTMKAMRAGTQPALVMHQIAAGYTDAEIEAMGDWFAKNK